jgi:hypothetical protein
MIGGIRGTVQCMRGGKAWRGVFEQLGKLGCVKRPSVVIKGFRCGDGCNFRCAQEVGKMVRGCFVEKAE